MNKFAKKWTGYNSPKCRRCAHLYSTSNTGFVPACRIQKGLESTLRTEMQERVMVSCATVKKVEYLDTNPCLCDLSEGERDCSSCWYVGKCAEMALDANKENLRRWEPKAKDFQIQDAIFWKFCKCKWFAKIDREAEFTANELNFPQSYERGEDDALVEHDMWLAVIKEDARIDLLAQQEADCSISW